MMRKIIAVLAAFLPAFVLQAKLTVEENSGCLTVRRNGNVLIESIEASAAVQKPVKSSFRTLPDGSKVWERWNDAKSSRIRLEVGLRADGAVEISMIGAADALEPDNSRSMSLTLPLSALDGKAYTALSGNARAYKVEKGLISTKYRGGQYRFMAVDGLTFDFNPLGPGDYSSVMHTGSIRGTWKVTVKDGKISMDIGSTFRVYGGMTGGKLIIREGKFEDYEKLHAARSFHFSDHLKPAELFCFGAKEHGKQYTDGNLRYDPVRKYGWLGTVPKPVISFPKGAYYSHVTTQNNCSFKAEGFPSGYYIVTVGAGNEACSDNEFSIHVNGEKFAEKVQVSPHKAAVLSKCIHVSDGSVRLDFSGKIILSTIGIQKLLLDGEDFSFSRPFWLAEGYEPSVFFRSRDFSKKQTFSTVSQVIPLPVPGKEMTGKAKTLERPVILPDPSSPRLAWVKEPQFYWLLFNSSTLDEMSDKAVRERVFSQEIEGKGFNCAMVSGMHSRHTYPEHIKRGQKAIADIVQSAHARNIRIMDHYSVTLLWNLGSGFRVLADRMGETGRGIADHLPSYQFCINNPQLRETSLNYIVESVKNGVDGFMLDEVKVWPEACGCQYCRASFYQKTGWQLPMNELDPAIGNLNSPLWKKWIEWRNNQVTDFLLEVRRRTAKINPSLFLATYTTHWGYTRSRGSIVAGHDIFEAPRVMNLIGTEVMTRCPVHSARALLPFRKMMNMFADAYGVSVWGTFYSFDRPSARYAWSLSNMVRQTSMLQVTKRENGVPDYAAFGKSPANMKREGTKHIAKVAIYFSSASRDWNSYVSFDSETFGLAQTLDALHVPYEFLAPRRLESKVLEKYSVLCLGAAGALSDSEVAAVKTFAERGGIVYLTANSGTLYEQGIRRRRWSFADVFKFSAVGGKPNTMSEIADIAGNIHTLEAPVKSFLPPSIKEKRLHIAKKYGKGRFIYCPFAIAGQFCALELTASSPRLKFNPDREARKFYPAEIKALFKPFCYWNTDAPPRIQTELWQENDGSIVIHFLNAAGSRLKHGERYRNTSPEIPFPPLKQDITFTLPLEKCSSAVAVSPDFKDERKLAYKQTAGGFEFTLSKELLDAYTIVRVKP